MLMCDSLLLHALPAGSNQRPASLIDNFRTGLGRVMTRMGQAPSSPNPHRSSSQPEMGGLQTGPESDLPAVSYCLPES